MGRDWARLAKAIEAARDTKGWTQVALAEAAGVSESTVQNLESGKGRKRMPSSLPKVERALGWRPGSGEAVLAGGDPSLHEPQTHSGSAKLRAVAGTSASGEVSAAELPLRIVQELADGPLLDTTVMDLTPLGSDARMIVVVKGTPDASPEQIRKDLLAWAKAQRLLQSMGDDGSSEIAN
ncbi:helix-turn-helix transcriptional regulator [Streptomyces sp. A3M-1-3]|uniref:helix-turn-helix domain-containing protein n=1 Tax=Streptomyces sp. A3M-1-3 TaxID=2962044 RepID=UPI0020B8506E|nr:helix-turn-helix transcriptional regulator [Streptomyces sp. A3M-1-3]MCP3820134.1 helix-turn-helix transcriptional regulator [Streptomyces sp. A3M-1-3]